MSARCQRQYQSSFLKTLVNYTPSSRVSVCGEQNWTRVRWLAVTPIYEKAKAINDEYRTAAMSRRYYGCRLKTIRHWNRALEIVVAIGSSAAIATWTVWQTGETAFVWKSLAAVATVVAVIKPFLGLAKEIERYSELVGGYSALFYDLEQLVLDMRTSGGLSDAMWQHYLAIRQRTKDLAMKDDILPSKRLHRRCYDQIKRELPAEDLWWPDEEST